MKPKSQVYFKVDFALTERLRNIPISFMQNILNTEIKRRQDQKSYHVLTSLTIDGCEHISDL